VSFLLSHILRDVSFSEVGRVCRVTLREPMNLCTWVNEDSDDGETERSETPSFLCTDVSEEGGDGEAARSETPSLLCTCVSEEGGDGEAARSETPSLLLKKEMTFFFSHLTLLWPTIAFGVSIGKQQSDRRGSGRVE
jgi:hypothetical protein